MTAQDYILGLLNELAKPVVAEDIGSTSIEDAIYAKVMSKKFRKLKADEDTVATAKKAINLAVSTNKPLTVGILFGGNKLWRFEEAPDVDWAELLSLVYYLQWMKTITSVYPPGAHLEYYSQDISVESLNNLTHTETKRYTDTFNELLAMFKQYLPKGVTVAYRCHSALFQNDSTYQEELKKAKAEVLKENSGNLPVLDEVQKKATELNVRLRSHQDDDPQWREKVELEHQAIFRTKSLLPYLMNPAIIPTSPTPFPGLIATGSTKR